MALPEESQDPKELERAAQAELDKALKDVEEQDNTIEDVTETVYERNKDLLPALRYVPHIRTQSDPETMTDLEKSQISVGTVIFREDTTPRRIYFKTRSGLYKLSVSGTTSVADGHLHLLTDIDVDFRAV